MTTTTYYAAIDGSDPVTGAIYGIGPTPEAALAEALRAGDPCVTHEDREPGHTAAHHFRTVPMTEGAYQYVEANGGQPGPQIEVWHDRICLRGEEG